MRNLRTLLLALAAFSLPPPQGARGAALPADPLVGAYLNATNGGACAVHARPGGGYMFVNENGDQAAFDAVRPGRLAITNTLNWDPTVVATVSADRRGRAQIRFDSPGAAPGVWVRAR
jgi:hypothetical protein